MRVAIKKYEMISLMVCGYLDTKHPITSWLQVPFSKMVHLISFCFFVLLLFYFPLILLCFSVYVSTSIITAMSCTVCWCPGAPVVPVCILQECERKATATDLRTVDGS